MLLNISVDSVCAIKDVSTNAENEIHIGLFLRQKHCATNTGWGMEISWDYDKNKRPFHLGGEGTATRRLFLREV